MSGWRKSRFSETGQCVEVSDLPGEDTGDYRKSTFSSANGQCIEVGWRKPGRSISNGACVEAGNGPGAVLVRDTTDRSGPVLVIPAKAWAAFTARTRGGGS